MSRGTEKKKLNFGDGYLENTEHLNQDVEYSSYGVAIAPPSAIYEADLPHKKIKTTVDVNKADKNKSETLISREKTLNELRLKLDRARELNKTEVVEEEKRIIEEKNTSLGNNKKKRKHQEFVRDEKAEENNKLLMTTIEDAKWLQKKKKPAEELNKWSAFNHEASFKAYDKKVSSMKTKDDFEYEMQRAQFGENFFPEAHSLHLGKSIPIPEENVQRMVDDLRENEKRRNKFSRRRTFYEDKDIDYINETNRKFNDKISRSYDKYTVEIKQNLERGTAI